MPQLISGDGVFAKGNAPFKNKMQELFMKELVFRWDPLHLINRAHIDAKGKVKGVENDDCDEDDESEQEEERHTHITELIDYIQQGAKKLRHGIAFSNLLDITSGDFKRPKVWSTTRMVVYEFEMIERFLQNSSYLDIPIKYMLLAKCQCLVMFALKIILKNVQRVEITPAYIDSVLVKENRKGKEAMKLANKVAVDIYLKQDVSYLEDESLIEKTNVYFRSDLTKKTFCSELLNYTKDNKDLFAKLEEAHERGTRSEVFSIQDAYSACEIYIKDLWSFIKKRVDQTDFSDNPCAFSEAPAEGIFSIYDRVITGKERLTIGNAVALTRVAVHGPPPASPDSAEISKAAMTKYSSKFGERYCTVHWRPGATSATLMKVESPTWDW